MDKPDTGELIVAGAFSGSAWFLLALAFDKGVRDFNIPVIPTNGVSATLASWLGAVATGVCVALAFRSAWTTRSRVVFWTAPLGTLALGIVVFSIWTWLAWLRFGEPSNLSAPDQFVLVLATFLLYGLGGIFTPILYLLALLNQVAIRHVVRHAT